MKFILALILGISCLGAQAAETPWILIKDNKHNRFVKVEYSENQVTFNLCDQGQICKPLVSKVFFKEEIERQIEALRVQQDQEALVTTIIVVGTAVFTFSGVMGINYNVLKTYLKHKELVAQMRTVFIIALSGGMASGAALGTLYQIIWGDANINLAALEKTMNHSSSNERLVLVDDVDDFITNLNDALLAVN